MWRQDYRPRRLSPVVELFEYRFPAPETYAKLSTPKKARAKRNAIESAKAKRLGEQPAAFIEAEYDAAENMFVVTGFIGG